VITAADLQARLSSSEDYLKLFDRAGAGVADAAFVATCLGDGQSELDTRLFAAFGETLDAAGGQVDAVMKRVAVTYAIRCALLLNPLLTDADAAPYKAAFAWADDYVQKLTEDQEHRLVVSPVGRARPRPRTTQTTTPDGAPTNPFGRARDGVDGSNF
jgi:hypothetical protein